MSRALLCILLFTGWSGWAAKPKGEKGPVLTATSESRLATNKFTLEIAATQPGVQLAWSTNGAPPVAPQSTNRLTLPVESTTVLRVQGFKGTEPAGPELVRTFIFPEQVFRQDGRGWPTTWGVNQGSNVLAYYRMAKPEHPADLVAGLRALPSLSIITSQSNLFDSVQGIYAHPQESGSSWERSSEVELLFPDQRKGFSIGCGLRIQGGWNRRPEESPKHALRLIFKKKYGAGKLKYPVFGETGPKEFDELILRAGCNNSWLHWSGEERRRGEYLRDQWMRESSQAMGHPAARGIFVHVYLNGLYWGIYNLTERPDAAFAAAHLGGDPSDYDSRNGEHILSGDKLAWEKMMTAINAGMHTPEQFAAIGAMVDLPAFADYMILNFYGANADWDRASNWYAARRRDVSGPFHFFVWDGERTLEQVADNTMAFDDDQSPPRLFHKLKESPEFRKLFAQRARLHLTGDGALTPKAAAARYRAWSEKLDNAILAEAARWGTYRFEVHQYKTGPYEPYTRDAHWRPEVQRLLNDYFPKRTDKLLEIFSAAGLYP